MNVQSNELDNIESVIKEKFLPAYWKNYKFKHVLNVVDNVSMICDKYIKNNDCDFLVCKLSAYFHDIGKDEKVRENHNIVGAIMAINNLSNYFKKGTFREEQLEKIKYSILYHGKEYNGKREFLEADILACADALDHIKRTISQLRHGYEPKWVKKFISKFKESWDTLSLIPELQEDNKSKHFEVYVYIKGLYDIDISEKT